MFTGHASKEIEGARGLCEELGSSDCNWLKGFAAQNLSQAYASLADHEHALQWAKVCYNKWENLSLADKAEGRKQILHSETIGRVVPAHIAPQLVATNWSHVQEERSAGLILSAVEKIEIVLSQVLLLHRSLDSSSWMDTFDKLIDDLPKEAAPLKRASFYQIKADLALRDCQGRTDMLKESEAVETFEKAIQIYIAQKETFHAANTRQLCALAHWGKHQKSPSILE
jgi:hypothetical protein